jgi:hypothetical protein
MTIYDELKRFKTHRDLTLALKIEGIRTAFTERTISAAALSTIGRPIQAVCMNRVKEGATQLDIERRREIAPTLDIELIDFDNLSLQALFASASARNTYVAANAEADDTEVTTGSTAAIMALVNSQGYCDIYIGSETITVVGIGSYTSIISNEPIEFGSIIGWAGVPTIPISSGTALQITRGAYESTPIELRGSTVDLDGDSVFLVPPSWKGRRAKLYGVIGDQVDVLGTFIIDGSPETLGERTWRLRFAGIAQRYYEKSYAWGLTEAQVAFSAVTNNGERITHSLISNILAVNDSFYGNSRPNYCLLTSEFAGREYKSIHRVFNVDDLGSISISNEALFGTLVHHPSAKKVQPILLSQGTTPISILSVIVSRGRSSAPPPLDYDIHAGRISNTFDFAGWSLGAGIPVADLDLTAWRSSQINYGLQLWPAATETKLEELLYEFCLLTDCFIVCDKNGRLKPLSITNYRNNSLPELTADDIDPNSVTYVSNDEGNISPFGKVSLDYSPIEDSYRVEMNLVDTDLAKRYPDAQNRKEFKFKSIATADGIQITNRNYPFVHPVRHNIGELASRMSKLLRANHGESTRTITVDVTLEQLERRVGDIIRLTSLPAAIAELPDFKGGFIEGVTCRIIEKRPDYDANKLSLKLQILNRALHVAPTATVASNATTTLTLNTTTPECRTASPANDFAIGAAVQIKAHNSDNFHETTVTSASGATLIVASVPGWITSGSIVCLNPFDSNFTNTVSGYSLSEIAGWTDDTGTATVVNALATPNPLWS